MSAPSLEAHLVAWTAADPAARARAHAALRGEQADPLTDQIVIRWPDLARRIGVTARAVRYAAKQAGISPVKFPGRQRAIGIRAADVAVLIGGGK